MTLLPMRHAAASIVAALLVVSAAAAVVVVPILPTIPHKVNVTLVAGVVAVAGLYGSFRLVSGAKTTPLDAPVLIFLALTGLATVLSVDVFVSFFPSSLRGEGWLTYAAYGAIAMASSRLNRQATAAVIAGGLVTGAIVGVLGALQYYGLPVDRWLGIDSPPPHFGRAYATLGNAMFLGGYTILLLPLAICWALTGRGTQRAVATSSAPLLGVALLTAQARAAWIGAAAAAAMAVAGVRWEKSTQRRAVMLAVLIAVVGVTIVTTRPSPRLARRASATFDVRDPSLNQRLYVWKHTAPLILSRPVFGWGFGTLLGRFPDAGSKEWQQHFGLSVVGIDTPHNEILHMAFSAGLLGLAAYVWIWFVMIRSLLATIRRGDPDARMIAVGLLAGMAGYAMWLQLAWSHMGITNVFWPFVGISVGLARYWPPVASEKIGR
jgi:O-antigen ligase